jgi:ABC-type multidrug transport system ATPase subunit
MPTLHVRDVTKVYPTLRRALDGVSLDIGPGVFGLLGPNGAGKSTLMAILAGELGFESGRVLLDRTDAVRHPVAWRRRLGYMPQTFDFVPHVTGRDYLRQCALLSGFSPRSLRARIDELLERVNLAGAATRDCATYSRGMKQRLAVAATLLCEPELVLLDEPTSGLDPQERVFFRELLASMSENRVVILSTHIVADVERCCGRIGVIARGALRFEGPPSDLVSAVAGKVWEVTLPDEEIDHWVESNRVVSLREEHGNAIARVVSDSAPNAGATPVDAHLEDAYMHLLEKSGERYAAAASEAGD